MDGRPPGNTGCCRLFFSFLFFFFFLPPLSFSARPPPPQAPPAAGPSHPTALRAVACLPAPPGVGGRGPDSRCRPGLPPGGPRAPPHSASRKPEDRRGRGWRGCSLSGAPLAGLRHFWAGPRPQPPPQPQPPARPQPHPSTHPRRQPLGLPQARAHNTHTHTHTKQSRTHTHTTPPPPRKVKSRRPQVRETEKEGERERDRQQEDHTDFQTPGRHTLSPPFWVPPGPQSTRPHRRPPTHSHTHSPALTLWPGGGGWVSP